MSRARHHEKHMKHRADGGRADYYDGGESNVAKEAAEKKHGGRVHKKHGGAVKEVKETKEVERMEAKKPKMRMDKRPRRAHGGRVGSDKSPFSSAAKPAQNTEAAKP